MLAYTPEGELVSFADPAVQERFAAYREPLHDGTVAAGYLSARKPQASRSHSFLQPVYHPLTDPDASIRAFLSPQRRKVRRGSHDERETVDSIWITPQEALERHEAKEFDLMNVTRIQLEALAKSPDKASLLDMSVNQRHLSHLTTGAAKTKVTTGLDMAQDVSIEIRDFDMDKDMAAIQRIWRKSAGRAASRPIRRPKFSSQKDPPVSGW